MLAVSNLAFLLRIVLKYGSTPRRSSERLRGRPVPGFQLVSIITRPREVPTAKRVLSRAANAVILSSISIVAS
jgi:hypothetical protein